MTSQKPKIENQELSKKALETIQQKLHEKQISKLREEGKEEYFKLQEGLTVVKFDLSKYPREETDAQYGDKTVFRVEIKGKPYDLPASNALARKILSCLLKDQNPLQIIRIGKDQNTRYSVRALHEE